MQGVGKSSLIICSRSKIRTTPAALASAKSSTCIGAGCDGPAEAFPPGKELEKGGRLLLGSSISVLLESPRPYSSACQQFSEGTALTSPPGLGRGFLPASIEVQGPVPVADLLTPR